MSSFFNFITALYVLILGLFLGFVAGLFAFGLFLSRHMEFMTSPVAAAFVGVVGIVVSGLIGFGMFYKQKEHDVDQERKRREAEELKEIFQYFLNHYLQLVLEYWGIWKENLEILQKSEHVPVDVKNKIEVAYQKAIGPGGNAHRNIEAKLRLLREWEVREKFFSLAEAANGFEKEKQEKLNSFSPFCFADLNKKELLEYRQNIRMKTYDFIDELAKAYDSRFPMRRKVKAPSLLH